MIYEKLLSEIRALEWTQKKLSYKGITIRGFYEIKKPLNTIFGKIWWLFWGAAYCYPAIYRPIKLYNLEPGNYEFMSPKNTFTVGDYAVDDNFSYGDLPGISAQQASMRPPFLFLSGSLFLLSLTISSTASLVVICVVTAGRLDNREVSEAS